MGSLDGRVSTAPLERQASGDPGDEPGLAVPMVVGAQVIGVLEFSGTSVDVLADDAVAMLETMAIHAATAIEAARLHEQTSLMAMTDALTGLRNRRQLNDDLRLECESSSRYRRPMSLLMIDVDDFKSYNDTYGHQAGDVALQAVAQLLAEACRSSDHAYRYGGEEFAVVMRETRIDEAAQLAERVRVSVQHHFGGPTQLRPITVSIGATGNDLVQGGSPDAFALLKPSSRPSVRVPCSSTTRTR